jgi:hypothetical protein
MLLDLLSKTPLPDVVPNEMQHVIDGLRQSPSQEDYLKNAYAILTQKYHGERVQTYLRLFDIFKHDSETLWNTNGFLHCTNLNYLMRILLVKSGFFTEADIRLKWTLIWYVSPHQYMQIRVSDTWINVDLWAYAYGIGFDDNAHGFH